MILRIGLFMFTIFFFLGNTFAEEGKVIEEDIGVFQLQKVYLLSDIRTVIRDFERFREEHPDAFLPRITLLDKVHVPSFPLLTAENLSQNSAILEKLLLLLKFYQYVVAQKDILEVESVEKREKPEGGRDSAISLAEQSESLLVNRFSESMVLFSASEWERLRSQRPGIGEEILKSSYKAGKREELMLNFLKSLNKQVQHRFLWK